MRSRENAVCWLASLAVVVPAIARGAAIVFTPGSATAMPGQNFSFDVSLDASSPFFGFSMYLDSSTASEFNVVSQTTLAGSPLTDPNFTDDFPILLPATGNSSDLGYTSNGTSDTAAGDYGIESLTVSVPADLPTGQYTFTTTTGVTGSEYNDAETDEYDLPAATFTLTVAVPEPCTLAIAVGAAIGALAVRRRRAVV
ncbi:MAG TPA: hypothetical protein VL992_20035 [Tepidisphaeraceae bacterium]|nr:hypothetical protein [Tepidisphaeraceae bacterium]